VNFRLTFSSHLEAKCIVKKNRVPRRYTGSSPGPSPPNLGYFRAGMSDGTTANESYVPRARHCQSKLPDGHFFNSDGSGGGPKWLKYSFVMNLVEFRDLLTRTVRNPKVPRSRKSTAILVLCLYPGGVCLCLG